MKRDYMKESDQAVKDGNWMVRSDNNGKSFGGFQWNRKGRWTTAQDWINNTNNKNGLFGQSKGASGFKTSGRMRVIFCKTKGEMVIVSGGDKVKVEKAMILLINKLPDGLKFNGDLTLSNSHLKTLPDNLSVGGSLDLRNTQIKTLPDNLSVGGSLDLSDTQIKTLPDNLSVGGSLDLRNTQIKTIPKHLKSKVIK